MNLKNKKVLITGATGGIGNSLVEKFNSYDAKIVATGTNEVKLDNLKKKEGMVRLFLSMSTVNYSFKLIAQFYLMVLSSPSLRILH